MKKYLLFIFMAMTAIAVHAEFNRLVFCTLDGEEQSVGLTDLSISFTNGEMIATSEGESVKIPLTALKSMEFSSGMSGNVTVSADNRLEGKITVYNTDGQLYGSFDSMTSACNGLPTGVYVFKAENGLTSKVLINR